MTSEFAGANWIERQLPYWNPEIILSPLGRTAADFLGELYMGIYHLDQKALSRVEWGNQNHIEISIGFSHWSTVDFDTLTRLVFLAHHMALRIELNPSTHNYMRMIIHQRKRIGESYQRCPTIHQALEEFNQQVGIPEYQDQPPASPAANGEAGSEQKQEEEQP